MDKAKLKEAVKHIAIGLKIGREPAKTPQPPVMQEYGPEAPTYDPITGRVTADYYVKGHMGAQVNSVYAQWSQCWMIYSMMGVPNLHDWVMAAPPPDNPALASPSCIDDNVRNAWEMVPPWAPTPS